MSAGILSQVSIGLETTFGTAVTPSKLIPVKAGDGIQTDIDLQTVQQVRGVLAKDQDAHAGKTKHEGSYEMALTAGNVGYFLKSALGGCASALKSGESVVYEHTLTEAETKPSLTIEQSVGEIVRRYAGSIATGFKLSVKEGESAAISFPVAAKSQASATAVTGVSETAKVFEFSQTPGIVIGGTTYPVQNLEIEYKNNGEMIYGLGSHDPVAFSVKGSELTGKFELYLSSSSASEYTDYLAGTEQAMSLVFTGASIGTASNTGISLAIPRAVYKTANYPINDAYNMLSVEFTGLYDLSTSKLISMVVTNTTAAYT